MAEDKHMTLSQFWEAVTPAEMELWRAFYAIRAEDAAKGGG
jgi:hypothetical protein